jgi:hypothetical protein
VGIADEYPRGDGELVVGITKTKRCTEHGQPGVQILPLPLIRCIAESLGTSGYFFFFLPRVVIAHKIIRR